MNNRPRFILALIFGLGAGVGAFGADGGHDKDHSMHDMPMMASTAPAESLDAAWLAAAKAAYPLTVCVVSGEELIDGDMGAPIDFVYEVDGQPDRLVRFCCEDCVGDFKKDPAKYLALIDEAVATKAKMDKAAGHDSHQH